MKAALMREYHRPLEFVDLPVPELSGPTDVLVRVTGAGVCATDLHAIDGWDPLESTCRHASLSIL